MSKKFVEKSQMKKVRPDWFAGCEVVWWFRKQIQWSGWNIWEGGGAFSCFFWGRLGHFYGKQFCKKTRPWKSKKHEFLKKTGVGNLTPKLGSGLLPLWRLEIAFHPRISIKNCNPVAKVSTRATPVLGSRFEPRNPWKWGEYSETLNPKIPKQWSRKNCTPWSKNPRLLGGDFPPPRKGTQTGLFLKQAEEPTQNAR